MEKPGITVIIPCYNYGSFLSEAIESVLNQTRMPKAILIADDASSDNTIKICIKYHELYPGIINYYSNDINLGIVKNFNKAASFVVTDYFCYLGADNRFKYNYLEETACILDNDSKVGVVYTDFLLFGKRAVDIYNQFNAECRGKIINETYEINFPEFTEDVKNKLRKNNVIHGSSLIRKLAFDEVGGYIYKEGSPEDHNLFVRIIDHGWSAKRAKSTMLEYRQHSIEQANEKLKLMSEYYYYKRIYDETSEVYFSPEWKLIKNYFKLRNIVFPNDSCIRKVLSNFISKVLAKR